jgi:hypothetical protein
MDLVVVKLQYVAETQKTFLKQHLLSLAPIIRRTFLDDEPDLYEILLSNLLTLDYVYPIGYVEYEVKNGKSDNKKISGKKEAPIIRKRIKYSENNGSDLIRVLCPVTKLIYQMPNINKKYQALYVAAGRYIRLHSIIINNMHTTIHNVQIYNDYHKSMNGMVFDVSNKTLITQLFYRLQTMQYYNRTTAAVLRAQPFIIASNKEHTNECKQHIQTGSCVDRKSNLFTVAELNYLREINIYVDPCNTDILMIYDHLYNQRLLHSFLIGDKSAIPRYQYVIAYAKKMRTLAIEHNRQAMKFGLYVKIAKALEYKYDSNVKTINEFIRSIIKLNGKSALDGIEHRYKLDIAEMVAIVTNICDHVSAFKILKSNYKIWPQVKEIYIGELLDSFYLCKKCHTPLICPHVEAFYDNKPLKEFYQRAIEDENMIVCKICQEVLINGSSGINEEDLYTGYDADLKLLIWKDLQLIKKYISFQKISDMKGNNRNLDEKIISIVYNVLYEKNIQLARIKSLSKDVINEQQTFYNHIYIVIVFLMLDYPIMLDNHVEKYKIRQEIQPDEVVKFIMRLNMKPLQHMNHGSQQVKAILKSASSYMQSMMFGEVIQIINPLINIINSSLLSFIIHNSISSTTPVINRWDTTETQRVFGLSIQELNEKNIYHNILKLNESDEVFEEYLNTLPLLKQSWIRWSRYIIKNSEKVLKLIDENSNIPNSLIYPYSLAQIDAGLIPIDESVVKNNNDFVDTPKYIKSAIISKKYVEEINIHHKWYNDAVRISKSRIYTMGICKPWERFHLGEINTAVYFDKYGDRRVWKKYVYLQNNKEIIRDRPVALDIDTPYIDKIDSHGMRWSELLNEGELDDENYLVNYRKSQWDSLLKNSRNYIYSNNSTSEKIYKAIQRKFIHIDFIEYEIQRLQNEGKEVNYDEISKLSYFEKHGALFVTPKWKVFNEKILDKDLLDIQTNMSKILYSAINISVYDVSESELISQISIYIDKISGITEIKSAYLWELGNISRRIYEDIPKDWDIDMEYALYDAKIINIFDGLRKNNNRYSPYRISNIRGYYIILHQFARALKGINTLLSRDKIYFSVLKLFTENIANKISQSIQESLLKEMDAQYKYLSPILSEYNNFATRRQQILGALYIFLKYILKFLENSDTAQFGIDILNHILSLDRNNCIPSATTYTNLESSIYEDGNSDAQVDINYEYNNIEMSKNIDDFGTPFYDFTFEGGEDQTYLPEDRI